MKNTIPHLITVLITVAICSTGKLNVTILHPSLRQSALFALQHFALPFQTKAIYCISI